MLNSLILHLYLYLIRYRPSSVQFLKGIGPMSYHVVASRRDVDSLTTNIPAFRSSLLLVLLLPLCSRLTRLLLFLLTAEITTVGTMKLR